MARKGIPRIRHLHHRKLERVNRQPIVTDFLTERATALPAYANEQEVWDALHVKKAETIAAEIA